MGPINLLFSRNLSMRIGRTILALLIAVSVAMLPAAGGVGMRSPPSTDLSAMEDMTGMSAMEDMQGCCPHKVDPCDKSAGDCCSMATCALKCFSFAGTGSATIVFPSTFAKMTAAVAANPFSSQTGSPPFRPPRA